MIKHRAPRTQGMVRGLGVAVQGKHQRNPPVRGSRLERRFENSKNRFCGSLCCLLTFEAVRAELFITWLSLQTRQILLLTQLPDRIPASFGYGIFQHMQRQIHLAPARRQAGTPVADLYQLFRKTRLSIGHDFVGCLIVLRLVKVMDPMLDGGKTLIKEVRMFWHAVIVHELQVDMPPGGLIKRPG